MLYFRKLEKWTNVRAEISVSGPDNVCYQDFKPFIIQDIHLECGSLYIPRNLSITKSINKIQVIARGQGTWQ